MHSITRRLFVLVWIVALALIPPFVSTAQNQQAFTVDDLFDVASVSVADISDDGRWVAATVARLRDRIGIDNSRFGDPTYFAPSDANVLVLNTQTGISEKLFREKRQVRQLKWSPDGSRLALLALKGDLFEPMIWERASNKWQTVKLPPSKTAARKLPIDLDAAGRPIADCVAPRRMAQTSARTLPG